MVYQLAISAMLKNKSVELEHELKEQYLLKFDKAKDDEESGNISVNMSDFDFLENFIRETETYETKEIDPTAMTEENEEGDSRLFNYRPRQYDNVEMRRTNLYNILTEITKLESNIINKSLTYLFFVTNITILSNFFLVSDYTFFFQSKTLIYLIVITFMIPSIQYYFFK